MTTVLAGLGLRLSLIIAIGAQNVFVLRQGIRRQHVLAVVLVCALSDAVLILAGVAGLGYLLEAVPWLVDVARWLGAAFLVGYAVLAAKRALAPEGKALTADEQQLAATAQSTGARQTTRTKSALPAVLGTALALTWLNPHVYLDTVFLLGSIAATHGDARWLFAVGAIAGSVIWFFALGFGARMLGRWLRSERSWRILDGVIAVVMLAIAVTLVVPVFA